MYKLLSFFPPPLTHRTKLIFRIGLTFALLFASIAALWLLPGTTLTFLLLGIGLSHIWITFGTVQTTASVPPRQRGVDPPSGASPVPTATATATTDYDKLTFTKAEGTVLVGRNSYILNHPLPLVSYAVFHKFPVLPCEEVPELISIQLMEETHPTHNCILRKRLITSKNIVPAALGSAMGLAETSMVLECSEEIDGVALEIVAQNEDALDFACLQVWEHFEQLPNGTTQVNAETWLATPGLNWFVGKAVHSFAGSMYAQKSPESQELLERRCEQVAATGEHLVGVDPPPETPSRPA